MKRYLLLIAILIMPACIMPQSLDSGRARGLFFSVGVGPRIPVSEFAVTQSVGYGLNMELSYTDNVYLPLFLYTRVGYEQFPGSVNYYRKSDYSSLTVHIIPVFAGAKLFLPPVVEDLVLILPTVELGASFAFFEKSHQFKIGSGRSNFMQDDSRFGFHIGAGISMFIVELMASYNYFPNNESLAADLKIRLPIFIRL